MSTKWTVEDSQTQKNNRQIVQKKGIVLNTFF